MLRRFPTAASALPAAICGCATDEAGKNRVHLVAVTIGGLVGSHTSDGHDTSQSRQEAHVGVGEEVDLSGVNTGQLGAVSVVGAQDGLETGLSGIGSPVGGGDGLLLGLAGGANQSAGVDVGLQDEDSAVKEEVDVVVAGVAGDVLDVEGLVAGVLEIQSLNNHRQRQEHCEHFLCLRSPF